MNTVTPEQVRAWQGPPLVLFVGVSTGGSLAHRTFGGWAGVLGRDWTLRGLDLPLETPPERYRELVAAIGANPAVAGAVVTAHKLRLYRARTDLDTGDRMVRLTREVSALAATGQGPVRGYARDAEALSHVLPPAPEVLCFGAGGAGTALLLALAGRGGTRATFADTDPRALDDLRAAAARAGAHPDTLRLVRLTAAEEADALVAAARGTTLVINATGLGKDRPGSPVTDRAPFGPHTTAWDFNYRGDLTFLRQAATKGAPTLDGWDYFVAGWAGALTAIAGVPFDTDLLTAFGRVAGPHRPEASA